VATTDTTLQVKGLDRRAMSELTTKAKRLGMTPARYIRELVEEDLALDRKARTTTLAQIMSSSREVDGAALDKLVDASRKRHHRRATRKR
jgi:hypothetical protein